MAQANAAHEPSMEEILASIRKIIEDNDDPENTGAAELTSPTTQSAPDDVGDKSDSPVKALKAANEPHKAEKPVVSAAAPDTDLRAAHSSAELKAVTDKKPAPPRGLPGDPGRSTRTGPAPQARPVSLARLAAQVDGASDQDDSADAARAESSRSDDASPAAPSHAGKTEIKAGAGKGQEPMTTQPDTSLLGARDARALISREAGDKVAASFDNLNHAVLNGPNRSFDEIAEDMLRPMLQQWLDDNLPTLVERLVREEIERVARGR
ncbi:DUF2497 domain-containing protein [Hoeflea sp.]|uniref:DUF2497 domain-containing protein n=1 Tax=Hoeflea sp. TaxID=1940281 RepID=UPI003B02030B